MPRGGKRAGAGRKFGTKEQQTLSKEAGREALRLIVMREMEAMAAAQVAHAKGISHFMLRDPKTGKFDRLTDADQIAAALNADNAEEGSTYYIWAKDPSVQAFTDLMNRALDKPKELARREPVPGGWPLAVVALMTVGCILLTVALLIGAMLR